MKISIIGFGRFGKLMAKHLGEVAEVVVTDIIDRSIEAEEVGVEFVSFDNALKNKIIVLAVPMENLVETLEKMKDKIAPETLVIDVCSLKMFSCKAMKEMLPENVEVIGTHPLFGPQSAPNSIEGMRIVICNVSARQKTFEKTVNLCKHLGLNVLISTPEEHDKQMAVSQALTHFVGQVAKRMGVQRVEMSTKTFNDIMDIVDIIKNDSKALFENMQTMNPFAKEVRGQFVEFSKELDMQLSSIQENVTLNPMSAGGGRQTTTNTRGVE